MTIFLVVPASAPTHKTSLYKKFIYPSGPIGIAYLAAVARDQGHEVIVIDQYATGIGEEDLVEIAVNRKVDLFGLSCLTPNMPRVESVVKQMREALPDVHIVLGNTHAVYFAEEIFRDLPIDSIVLGEGEQTFVELLQRLETGQPIEGMPGIACRSQGGFIRGPVQSLINSLDELPRPAWDLFRLEDYYSSPQFMMKERLIPVQSSRGCPYRCNYCSQDKFFHVVRKRDMTCVVDEFVWLRDEFGITSSGFADPIFPLSKRDGYEFCSLLAERGIQDKVCWLTETRYELMSLDLLYEFKRCGCQAIMYGIESANERLLNSVNKTHDLELAKEVMCWTKKAGINSYGLFMIGFPDETLIEARATIRFAKELDCTMASFGRVTPYPGTALYEEYKDTFPKGIQAWKWNSQYRSKPGENMWELPGLSHAQITNLLREAMISYYLRPRIILRHLLRGSFSLTELVWSFFALTRDVVDRMVYSLVKKK